MSRHVVYVTHRQRLVVPFPAAVQQFLGSLLAWVVSILPSSTAHGGHSQCPSRIANPFAFSSRLAREAAAHHQAGSVACSSRPGPRSRTRDQETQIVSHRQRSHRPCKRKGPKEGRKAREGGGLASKVSGTLPSVDILFRPRRLRPRHRRDAEEIDPWRPVVRRSGYWMLSLVTISSPALSQWLTL